MKGFKVLSFMSVFLLLFAGVALAQNADSVYVEISYPCPAGQDECDTGEAVSRCEDGDVVNVYVTLLDAAGNPATAGPNGELLTGLTATVSSTLGNITPNGFAADAETIAFAGDATARANIDYTGATPGVDQVIATVSSKPDALVGQASVNVVAPPAGQLVVRTLRSSLPPQNIYDDIPAPQNNGDADEPAGFSVPVTVIADEDECDPLFTPDPALEGQQVTVMAYADYSEDGIAGGGEPSADIAAGFESTPVGEATLTFVGGIATGTVTINSAGPDGLDIVFTAEVEDGPSTTLMGPAGVSLADWTVDTVTVNPLTADALVIGSDPYGSGNLVVPEDCYAVLDDNTTAVGTEIILVDSKGNAVRAGANVAVNGDLGTGSILDTQLTFSCDNDQIDSGDYAEACSIQDTNAAAAGVVVSGPLTVSDTTVASDSVTIDLLPASGAGVLDLDVTTDAAGDDINAGDEVTLTLSNAGGYFPFASGEMLEISAMGPGGAQWISTSDFASASTMLMLPATDADPDTAGLQIGPIEIYGPCTTTAGQNVMFTVGLPSRCDVSAVSDAINDIDPGDPANLAVVGLAAGLETDSDLDVPKYVGTDPVAVDTPLIADGSTSNDVLDCGDLEVRDEYDNVLDAAPVLSCTSSSGLGILTVASDCEVSAVWVVAAADTTDTISCEATDYPDVDGRNISIPLISEEEEEAAEEATALIVRQEGPQTQDGDQTVPCGEAIVQIFANGPLAAPISIELSFAEGSVAGAELRTLTSNNALPVPFAVALAPGQVLRYVVYAPDSGPVTVVATDLGADPLDAGELPIGFCGDIPQAGCVVTVTCGDTDICPDDDCTTCTAATECDGIPTEGTYTWAINGAAAGTGGTMGGNTLEVCPEDLNDGSNTVTAVDTTNNDEEGNPAEDDSTITFNGSGCQPVCLIDVLRDSIPKSHWYAIPAVFRIETIGIENLNFFTPVTIECDADGDTLLSKSVLKLGKVVLPNFGTNTTVILQAGLIWPAWWTQSLALDSETCTVTVGSCGATDTFELDYLSLGAIPLSE
jgi:hypothetical protein